MYQARHGSVQGVYLSNRGVDNRSIFNSKEDFDRFEAYLYLLNAVEGERAANYFVGDRVKTIFESNRGDRLVSIAAFSFLPSEFHILARPLVSGGISKFMQKLQTAYTMYFNYKYGRTGRIFHGGYHSQTAADEDALKRLFAEVHLQPARLFNGDWESVEEMSARLRLARHACEYRYSSVHEYAAGKFCITSPKEFPSALLRAKNEQTLLRWMDR